MDTNLILDTSFANKASDHKFKFNHYDVIQNNEISITINKGIDCIDIPLDYINKIVHSKFSYIISYEVTPIVEKVINNLLKVRDFLGYQLDYQMENINDDEFEKITEKFLVPNMQYNIDDLLVEVKLLMKITNNAFDSDQISIMFNCDVDDAENVIDKIIVE